MRKRTITFLTDKIFWYLIYSLPLLLILLVSFRSGTVDSISSLLSAGGFTLSPDNLIYTTLLSLFGSSGVMPLFSDTGFIMLATWFVSTFIVHIAVDIVLWVPRFCHMLLSKSNQGDED